MVDKRTVIFKEIKKIIIKNGNGSQCIHLAELEWFMIS
jgi:hypothetical protein